MRGGEEEADASWEQFSRKRSQNGESSSPAREGGGESPEQSLLVYLGNSD